ncbi:hypothetical protein M514_04054 [Trichuris suis]|uniref:Uncharacterized protein n=1 Tax=Trichuris suis TaxID=68888 RepID=A0A085NSR3_9BILA|nr:hypothetical protein M514_04054 [Trichuris suis]
MSNRKKKGSHSRRAKGDDAEKLTDSEKTTCSACKCCHEVEEPNEKNDLVPFTWLQSGYQSGSSALVDYAERWGVSQLLSPEFEKTMGESRDDVSQPLSFCSVLRKRLEELKREDDRLWDSARSEFLRQQDFLPPQQQDNKAKINAAYDELFESGKQMRHDLVRLLQDFSSRKEEMFSSEEDFVKMKSIRRQQEKLMNLHIKLVGSEMTVGEQGEALRQQINENNAQLMAEISVLSEMT